MTPRGGGKSFQIQYYDMSAGCISLKQYEPSSKLKAPEKSIKQFVGINRPL